MTASRVRVAVRVRPQPTHTGRDSSIECVSVDKDGRTLTLNPEAGGILAWPMRGGARAHSFSFDAVHGQGTTQVISITSGTVQLVGLDITNGFSDGSVRLLAS